MHWARGPRGEGQRATVRWWVALMRERQCFFHLHDSPRWSLFHPQKAVVEYSEREKRQKRLWGTTHTKAHPLARTHRHIQTEVRSVVVVALVLVVVAVVGAAAADVVFVVVVDVDDAAVGVVVVVVRMGQ